MTFGFGRRSKYADASHVSELVAQLLNADDDLRESRPLLRRGMPAVVEELLDCGWKVVWQCWTQVVLDNLQKRASKRAHS